MTLRVFVIISVIYTPVGVTGNRSYRIAAIVIYGQFVGVP